MTNSKHKAEELIDKYLSGDCSPEECRLVENIYQKTALKRSFEDKSIDFSSIAQESWKQIHASINKKSAGIYTLWRWFAVAAAVIVIVGAGLWFYVSQPYVISNNPQVIAKNDIPPGGNAAILTLANGKKIQLSNDKTGLVIDASKLSYNDGSSVETQSDQGMEGGTISTPRGGQYQVKLPDGTNVWLNSASKLSFSSMSANSSVRNIALEGEAYFEVAKVMTMHGAVKSRMAFVVKTPGQEVHVLGTHFNINSYRDKGATITTLIEGAIRVTRQENKAENILKPGEQSILTADNELKVTPANIKDALAWKNGYFRFNSERIDQVMIQLSRWYDIEVSYEGEMSDEKFSGNISRYKNISEVLTMLSYSNAVKFKIEGRRVTVMK
ncbi:FecR family protein [Pedobacter nyackensis]|uniref:FecR family protein n=1 Tax=Pedobacter nyackensis TaxID=475255 RepID=UPI002931302D|nr:FecR domain-containing protein [Pedobacter nyackensis]